MKITQLMTTIIYIDLQLFAEEVINTTASEGLSPEMKTYYDKSLIIEAQAKLVHAQFGQKRPIPKNGGKQSEFRRFASLPKATEPLTEGVTPPGKELGVSKVTAELSQYGDYVKLSDVVQLTAIDPILDETVVLVGQQGGLTLDTVVRNVLNSGTNVFYAPKVAADGTVTEITDRADLTEDCQLTCDVVDQVVANLRAQNAPTIDGYYVSIIHPYAAYDLKKDPAWRKPHEYCDPEYIYKGEIGEYGGVRFVDTSEAKIFSGEGCPEGLGVFSTLFMGANAYGVTEIEGGNMQTIVKQLGSGGTSDPLNQRGTAGWKAMLTAEILIVNYLTRVESCSKAYSHKVSEN